ncbi:MAG: MFS transporter [Candidatus Promineifilaceae bacterium]
MKEKSTILSGFQGFTIIWFGQLISLLGTGATRFALTVWVFQETGTATSLVLSIVFSFAPLVIFSPIAGVLVDRLNRKLVVMMSDIGAGCATLFLLIMFSMGRLEIWHIYVAGFVAGSFEAFQFPAFSAATTLMLNKAQYGRASGMLGTAGSASQIAAPILGGLLLTFIGLNGIFLIDIATVVIAVLCISIVYIPQPAPSSEDTAQQTSFWQDTLFGFRYIAERPSLLGMQTAFSVFNLLSAFGAMMLTPLILARTGSNEIALGTVQSAAGIGALAGGIMMSTWGGPKRRVHGVFIGMLLSSVIGTLLLGVAQVVTIWAFAAFAQSFFIPVMNGSNQAIWQSKVPPALQGRVFATRRLIAQVSMPIALLFAGPLADQVLEPAMMSGGTLAPTFGWLVGTGTGAGIGLMITATAALSTIAALACYAFPVVSNIEEILPDFDEKEEK